MVLKETQYARIDGFRDKIELTRLKEVFGVKLNDSFQKINSEGEAIFSIERPSCVVQSLIDFAITGELHVPKTICMSLFVKELEYWNIPCHRIERCCYSEYIKFTKRQANILNFEKMVKENSMSEYYENGRRPSSVRAKIWEIVDRQNKTKYSKVNYMIHF